MVEVVSKGQGGTSVMRKAPNERSPAETAELMKRLYKMPYEIITSSSTSAAAQSDSDANNSSH